jgi:hypothetical protein
MPGGHFLKLQDLSFFGDLGVFSLVIIFPLPQWRLSYSSPDKLTEKKIINTMESIDHLPNLQIQGFLV